MRLHLRDFDMIATRPKILEDLATLGRLREDIRAVTTREYDSMLSEQHDSTIVSHSDRLSAFNDAVAIAGRIAAEGGDVEIVRQHDSMTV